MYSSNHSVRYCSILNLHIIITQMVLPNQSKHMDMILRELCRVLCRAACRHTHKHTHAHFPKVKQMPNTIFPARDNQSLMKQVIPPGRRPSPHPCGCCRFMHQHSSGTHTHTSTHTPVSNTAICQPCHMREPGCFILCQDCML